MAAADLAALATDGGAREHDVEVVVEREQPGHGCGLLPHGELVLEDPDVGIKHGRLGQPVLRRVGELLQPPERHVVHVLQHHLLDDLRALLQRAEAVGDVVSQALGDPADGKRAE